MSVIVRRARETDATFLSDSMAVLQALHAVSLPTLFKPSAVPYLPEKLLGLLGNPASHLFIADVGGASAGFAHLWIVNEPEGENNFANKRIFISYVYTKEESRGKGVGKALLGAAQTLARELDILTLELNVMAFNVDARLFLKKCGFNLHREILTLEMPER